MKKASVFIESLIVFFVIICCIFIFIPFTIKSTDKEKSIVEWSQKYSNIEYAYNVLKAQHEENNAGDLMSTLSQKKIKIFLREKFELENPYKPKFINDNMKKDIYVFDKFFENENGVVLSFKWINPKCNNNQICAVMLVDINGQEKPNKWGKDVFGVNIYRDRVEPAGTELSLAEMKKDCSRKGTGVACSAYYLIGGRIVK